MILNNIYLTFTLTTALDFTQKCIFVAWFDIMKYDQQKFFFAKYANCMEGFPHNFCKIVDVSKCIQSVFYIYIYVLI